MLKLSSGLALACLVTPAVAAGPACPAIIDGLPPLTSDQLATQAIANGDTITADMPVKGVVFDQIMVDVDTKGVWLWFLADGCVISKPLFLGPVPAKAPGIGT